MLISAEPHCAHVKQPTTEHLTYHFLFAVDPAEAEAVLAVRSSLAHCDTYGFNCSYLDKELISYTLQNTHEVDDAKVDPATRFSQGIPSAKPHTRFSRNMISSTFTLA